MRYKMIIHNFEQGTPEWFAVRLGKLTASNAQAIASNGAGLDTLVFEKVAELMTGKMKESYTNVDIERGNELEKMARNSYELETGIIVTQVGFVEQDEFVGCSPDGLIAEDGLQEIKCKNDANFARFLYDKKIDTEHMWQMQMQLSITGRKYVDYSLFNPNFPKPLIITKVLRDEVAIAKINAGILTGVAKIKSILEKIK